MIYLQGIYDLLKDNWNDTKFILVSSWLFFITTLIYLGFEQVIKTQKLLICVLLSGKEDNMTPETLQVLKDAVRKETDAKASVLVLVTGLAAQLKAAAGDNAAVLAIVDQLNADASDMSAAVVANTPAA